MPLCRFECAPVTWAPDTNEPGCSLSPADLPTMRASDWRSGATSAATAEKNARPLAEVLTMLPTRGATDATKAPRFYSSGNPSLRESLAPKAARETSPPGSGSLLDPGWCEAFMGFPEGWTDPGSAVDGPAPVYEPPGSTPSETPSSPPAPKSSAG